MNIEMVRIYLKESEHHVHGIMKILRERKIKHGVALRAIEGEKGSAHLMGVSLDLPIVIEFFDIPEKVQEVLPKVRELVQEGHIIKHSGELLS
ncbi:MAG: DUF190 domain-containing protein [Chlamydiia bacterium]|nr:DUF190 domain-containing protein [Chlamydiia bacterium]